MILAWQFNSTEARSNLFAGFLRTHLFYFSVRSVHRTRQRSLSQTVTILNGLEWTKVPTEKMAELEWESHSGTQQTTDSTRLQYSLEDFKIQLLSALVSPKHISRRVEISARILQRPDTCSCQPSDQLTRFKCLFSLSEEDKHYLCALAFLTVGQAHSLWIEKQWKRKHILAPGLHVELRPLPEVVKTGISPLPTALARETQNPTNLILKKSGNLHSTVFLGGKQMRSTETGEPATVVARNKIRCWKVRICSLVKDSPHQDQVRLAESTFARRKSTIVFEVVTNRFCE